MEHTYIAWTSWDVPGHLGTFRTVHGSPGHPSSVPLTTHSGVGLFFQAMLADLWMYNRYFLLSQIDTISKNNNNNENNNHNDNKNIDQL